MVLVNSSIWVDHFRRGNAGLILKLEQGEALIHPWILGELATGQLRQRAKILTYLKCLPSLTEVPLLRLLSFVEEFQLYSKGLGLVDCQLLASAIESKSSLMTLDKGLAKAAASLGVLEKE